MDAAVNAGHGFFFGFLPEAVEVPCNAGEPAGQTPGDGHWHVVRAANELEGARRACSDRRQIAGVFCRNRETLFAR